MLIHRQLFLESQTPRKNDVSSSNLDMRQSEASTIFLNILLTPSLSFVFFYHNLTTTVTTGSIYHFSSPNLTQATLEWMVNNVLTVFLLVLFF